MVKLYKLNSKINLNNFSLKNRHLLSYIDMQKGAYLERLEMKLFWILIRKFKFLDFWRQMKLNLIRFQK